MTQKLQKITPDNGQKNSASVNFESLSRNEVVAGIVGILTELPPASLPDELQVFLSGGLDRTDDDTMSKIAVTLVSIAKKLYSRYLVSWKDIEELYNLHLQESYLMLLDSSDMRKVSTSFEDDDSDDFMQKEVQDEYNSTQVWKFCLQLDAKRREMENIPYCLSEKDVNEVAKFLWKNQKDYKSWLLNVWDFVKWVLEKWWQHMSGATKQNWTTNRKAIWLFDTK